MHSESGRRRKAATMLAILKDAFGEGALSSSSVLNVGCSTGLIDDAIASDVGSITGIDIDEHAVEIAQRTLRKNVDFQVGDAMNLQFSDCQFDIVLCSQVYEHVPDARKMMDEIFRVLRPGGLCYFAATNRLCVIEQHYKLPFLSIMPVWAGSLYLRLLGRGKVYHERHFTLPTLKTLVSRFDITDYTERVIVEPARFNATYMINAAWKRGMALWLLKHAYWAFPGYIWLLRKPGAA